MPLEACPCAGNTLNRMVQPAVMAVLAREPLHGYLILQRLSAMSMFRAQPPDPTGVYRILKTMEEDGLVTSTWDLKKRGPARRQFALTPDGRACLQRWAETLQAYAVTLADLLAVMRRGIRTRQTPRAR